MRHRDLFGRELHIGQPVNLPDPGRSGHVWALGRAIDGASIVMVTYGRDKDLSRHLASDVVGVRRTRR